MKKLWKVWFSKRRHIYKVYHLGHGGRGKTPKDMKILEELQQRGIISYIYPW